MRKNESGSPSKVCFANENIVEIKNSKFGDQYKKFIENCKKTMDFGLHSFFFNQKDAFIFPRRKTIL